MGKPRLSSAPSSARAVARADAMQNLATGLGVAGQDSRTAVVPVVQRRAPTYWEAMWRADAYSARIIEKPAEAMTMRRGDVRLGEDKAAEERVAAELDDLDIWARLATALKYARAYGGGALLLGVDDGLGTDLPLDSRAVLRLTHLTPITRQELTPVRWYRDPLRPRFGEVEVYAWQPVSPGGGATRLLVHESRLLVFTGVTTSPHHRVEEQGWGDSILARCVDALWDAAGGSGTLAALLASNGETVLGLKDLATLLSGADGKAKLRARLDAIRMARSAIGYTVVDKDDALQRQAAPLSGAGDAFDRLLRVLAAAADIPLSVLMGEAPAGLSATGSADMDNWHAYVEAQQEAVLRPRFNRLLRVLLRSQQGPTGGVEPPKWMLVFRPLRQETQKEVAERRKLVADTDALYINSGVLTPEEVALSRFGGPEWSAETKLETKDRAALAAARGETPETGEGAAAPALGVPALPPLTTGEVPA
ncbi:DUF1073 domain-containing protein [Corallococcus sp. AB004]|nr:DUF1073 domain-containing protein [Corallococcus sp. AB004]